VKVEVIKPHGLCAGVNAAVAKALALKDVYCLNELVHNEIVVDELKALGYRFVKSIEEVPEGESVVFSAHGVSPQVRKLAKERSLKVIDTTCPFVAKVHQAVKAFAKNGLPVVLIGDRRHVEVKGIIGEADHVYVVGNIGEVKKLPIADRSEIGVVSQTTFDAQEVERIAHGLSERYRLSVMAKVCTATYERQEAVRKFDGDAILVLGSKNSANTNRLCEIAPCKALRAGTMDEVRALDLRGVQRLGLTSGASTPERFFDEALKYLRNIPRHVAIIMDGNGRWATRIGKKRSQGHVAGARKLDEVLDWCGQRGIQYLTVYAFSTENWKRPREEVDGLMKLFAKMLKSKAKAFVKNRVRFRMIGRRGDLNQSLLNEVERLEELTKSFDREFIAAISYGGRAEIIDAINKVKGPVTEETFRQYLYAPDVPDPDLVIRTSGELRTSNFLLWESAYSEYYFTDALWPDFSEEEFDRALESYAQRNRRQGGL
jgi:undecaprenyl diphosphate synthase